MSEGLAAQETIKESPGIDGLLSRLSIRQRFEEMLGKKTAGFMSSIISATNANSELKKADPMSVISAAAIAASLDLPINPSLGFAHIVPYGGKAQFQMGWRGYVQMAQRTGQYTTINVAVVYEGELIEQNRFTGEMKFDGSAKKSDTVIGYVAYFRLLNGFEKWYYMTKEEAAAHGKKYSKSFRSESGRWQQDFDAMALKTVIKMLLSKYGILSIGMEKAIQADQAVVREDGEYEYTDNEPDVTAKDIEDRFKTAKDVATDPDKKDEAKVATPQYITPGEVEIIKAMLKDKNMSEDEFKMGYEIEAVEKVLSGDFKDAQRWLAGRK